MRAAKERGARPARLNAKGPAAGRSDPIADEIPPETRAGRTRTSGRARADRPQAAAAAAAGSGLLLLFMISLLIPVRFTVLGLLLTPDRLLLLIVFVPLALRLISGKAGGIRPVDAFVLLYCIWVGIALLVVHGTSHIPFIGITIIELFGGYLVGRTIVRSQTDYRTFFRYFFWGLLFLLPFVLIEQVTRRLVISELLGTVFTTPGYVNYDQRMGMNRVQAVFEHPILFGMFCSVGIANFYYLYRRTEFKKSILLTAFGIFMTFMSVSSSALLSIILQVGMIIWDKMTNSKWTLFVGLVVAAYFLVDILSNRTPVQVLISYATLNSGSAGMRLVIWEYGSASVAKHPVFGIGLNDWERIWWLHSPSVDNFWLLNAMRYGLPAVLFLMTGIGFSLWGILRRRDLSDEDADCRTGYMVAAVALFFTLCTVHVWGPTSVFVMFYIGAGVWLAEAGQGPEGGAAVRGGTERAPRAERKSVAGRARR